MVCYSSPPLKPQQLNTLQGLVSKHILDPSLSDFATSDDFSITSTERGLKSWEQAHLVAALDVLNAYQSNRRARAACQVAGYFPGTQRQFTNDPRTRAVELLKRWLRTHAGEKAVSEDDVRGICGFCRDLLNHPQIFPARNPRSFLRTIAEVYEHVQWQLRAVLEHDRTCAQLAHRVLSLSRNFVSDVVSYLLLAATDLRQTDALPSLEVVALWQSLPDEGHPIAGRSDPSLQRAMRDAWRTQCGTAVAAILQAPWCVTLFKGAAAEEDLRGKALKDADEHNTADEVEPGKAGLSEVIAAVREQFVHGDLRCSGLAGAFRTAAHSSTRERYMDVVQDTFDLVYLLGEVLVHFHRVSDALGDYGMIRAAPWLHPVLESIVDKVQRVKANVEKLNEIVEGLYVLARARGAKVEKPAPSSQMSARAHASIERAVAGRGSHAVSLLQAVEELRVKSSPERLPHVMEGLGDACVALQTVLSSSEFRACVGESFPSLPALGGAGDSTGVERVKTSRTFGSMSTSSSCTRLQLEDSIASSETEVSSVAGAPLDLRLGGLAASTGSAQVVSSAAGAPLDLGPGGLGTSTGSAQLARAPPRCELQADVYRLVSSGPGRPLRRHDQRLLMISNGRLLIFEKRSSSKIKTAVDIATGVEFCRLAPGGLLSFIVKRAPLGATLESGVSDPKPYTFEFPDEQLAAAFHNELTSEQLPML